MLVKGVRDVAAGGGGPGREIGPDVAAGGGGAPTGREICMFWKEPGSEEGFALGLGLGLGA